MDSNSKFGTYRASAMGELWEVKYGGRIHHRKRFMKRLLFLLIVWAGTSFWQSPFDGMRQSKHMVDSESGG